MEKSTQKQDILNKKVVRRLLGTNFSLFREYKLQRLQGGDEAAAKDGYHVRSDKENQIKRKDGC